MEIAYRTPSGSGAFVDIANESTQPLDDQISGFNVRLGKSPMPIQGYGALTEGVLDLGNAKYTMAFTVDRQHANAGAALDFLAMHPITLGQAAGFDIQITMGAAVTLLSACALTELSPDPHSDQSSKIKYTFTGGSYAVLE